MKLACYVVITNTQVSLSDIVYLKTKKNVNRPRWVKGRLEYYKDIIELIDNNDPQIKEIFDFTDEDIKITYDDCVCDWKFECGICDKTYCTQRISFLKSKWTISLARGVFKDGVRHYIDYDFERSADYEF